MINPAPLLILLGSLGLLALIEYWLTRPRRPQTPAPAQKRIRNADNAQHAGFELFPEISVTGLDERAIDQLRSLVKQADIPALSSFLAFNQPGIPELISYINQIQKIIISNNYGLLSELDGKLLGKMMKAIHLPASPSGFRITELSDDELADLLEFDQNKSRHLNRDFMARFGGHDFYRHFSRYTAYEQHKILHIPPADPDRPSFDILAGSGLAIKGRDIDMAQRLGLLNLEQLKRMAADLNLQASFRNKTEAIRVLAGIQGSRALFSMKFVLDDLFALQSIDEPPEAIRREWGYLNACARLLVSSQTH